MKTRKVYTWHVVTRKLDAPWKVTDPGAENAPWTPSHHDGGPYSTRGAAILAARAAVNQFHPLARPSAPEIREHAAPVSQKCIDEIFPKPRTAFSMDVYRSADGMDCTARGESSRAVRILAVVDGELFTEPGPLKPEDAETLGMPVFVVDKAGGRFHLRPESAGDAWCMFGGNFAYSCDSRTPQFPVHIHDRIEK